MIELAHEFYSDLCAKAQWSRAAENPKEKK